MTESIVKAIKADWQVKDNKVIDCYEFPNGEKRIGINNGNEYVKLSGIIRPADIDSTNTVESTKIGDATIQYVGDGDVANSSKLGWLAKFFISAILPF